MAALTEFEQKIVKLAPNSPFGFGVRKKVMKTVIDSERQISNRAQVFGEASLVFGVPLAAAITPELGAATSLIGLAGCLTSKLMEARSNRHVQEYSKLEQGRRAARMRAELRYAELFTFPRIGMFGPY